MGMYKCDICDLILDSHEGCHEYGELGMICPSCYYENEEQIDKLLNSRPTDQQIEEAKKQFFTDD